jgi:hypothetical protein
MAGRLLLGLVVLGAVLVAVFAGWGGLFVYAFFAAIAAALAWAAGAGGDWLERSSRGRFHGRDEGR